MDRSPYQDLLIPVISVAITIIRVIPVARVTVIGVCIVIIWIGALIVGIGIPVIIRGRSINRASGRQKEK